MITSHVIEAAEHELRRARTDSVSLVAIDEELNREPFDDQAARFASTREQSAPPRLGERFELRVAAELEQDRADVIANRALGHAEA